MIVITGASGFIGSALVGFLNEKGHGFDLIVVDDFYKDYKDANLNGKIIREWIHRDIFLPWFKKSHSNIDLVIHLGARTDTTEKDSSIFDQLNVNYSKTIWSICTEHDIPLIYASSAATYGDGQFGFSDDNELTSKLSTLNPYGESKLEFDRWVLSQKDTPPRWYGIRFFNVFGPNEYHKKRMASVVFHAYRQITETGEMNLFRSHRDDYKNGHQRRDFIYVKDVANTIFQLMESKSDSGIYNLGTGQSRTFLDLVGAIFQSLRIKPAIGFIDTPEDIRESYQYFTEADMSSWEKTDVNFDFEPLEVSVKDYVQKYLYRGLKYM